MYAIYANGQCIHSNVFALDSMKAINPKLTLSDCAAGSLTMTLPSINVGYGTIERMTTDITVEKDGVEIWMGRVLSETKDFWNNRVLYCEGELAFFNDSTQPPKKYSGKTVRGYLQELIAVHNAKVPANRRFTLGVVTVQDDKFPDYFTNYKKTMASINALIEAYGGHMRVRKENGVRYLDYLEECPNTCSQTIQMGVNLIDFTKSWDMSEFATVIVPLGARLKESKDIPELDAYLTVADVNGGSIYVQSASAVAAYGWIEKTVQWDEVTDAQTLLEKAQEYLSDLQFDNMQLELSALDMHYLDINVEAVKLLDEIRVISLPHGLDRVFPVTQLEIPLDSPEKTEFKLGDTVKVSLTDVNNKTNQAILNKIEDLPKAHNILEEARENATAIMNLATTGYITITKNENGSEELWITNTQDYTAASKFWKWNMNGLGYSKDGGKSYEVAITMDGAIVANFITAGVLNGNVIRAGTIKDYGGNVEFDLDNGKLTMKKGSIYLGAYDKTSKHYKFEVDEEGNLYAGSGTFAGNLAAAKGTFNGTLVGVDGEFKGTLTAATGSFYGTVRAAKYEDLNGNDMMENGKFKSKYLSLYGITITNASTQQTSFAVSSTGAVTINGKVTMGAGSSINWAQVSNMNLWNNPAYSLASNANDTANQAASDAADAADDADAAYSLASSANRSVRTLDSRIENIVNGNYRGGTFIDGTMIYAPTMMGGQIYWGQNGTYGSLIRTYGSDGQSRTDIVELYSSDGVVIYANTGMRFEAASIWVNLDYSDIHVRKNGYYVDLGTLIEALAPRASS